MSTRLPHLDDPVRDHSEDVGQDADRPGAHAQDDGYDDGYDDDDGYEDGYEERIWPADSRWRSATAVLGAVLALGAIATAVIINSGDSATTKATVAPGPRPVTSAPSATRTITAPSPSSPPRGGLPPETVTTVAPSSRTPTAAPLPTPTETPTAAPPAVAAPPTTALNPRTVVYSVTGTKQLLDLVNVVYTDARGYPQTEFNVSLPWSKVIVLNPGVGTGSVIATSFAGRLNCSIVNAAGQPVAASTNNAIIATCTG
ncbi:MAG: MmpS family transport accessory protein [Mycobacterium sp.]|nr:MmpS family transport accessory protein [Mycobacterium sp.]